MSAPNEAKTEKECCSIQHDLMSGPISEHTK